MSPLSDELDDDDWPPEYRRLMASMRTGAPRWFLPVAGRYQVALPDGLRQLVGRLVADLRDLVLTGEGSLQRLYPTAYPDDPARNQEYSAFAHDQLLMARLEGYDTVERTLGAADLSGDEVDAWMRAVNEARLVLGTRLDVIEDDPRDDDPDHPQADLLHVYHLLGAIVGDLVDARHPSLPPT